MASEIRNRFTDTEMQIARETDLPELLSHLGYQVKRVGRFHTTAELDSLRIKDRRTWFRYSQGIGGSRVPADLSRQGQRRSCQNKTSRQAGRAAKRVCIATAQCR